jgi:glycosyltransferase involved in cell wall biosynthesis
MLNIFAPINPLGYGVHSCNVIKSLIEEGEEVNLTTIGEVQLDPFYEIYVKETLKNKDNFNKNNPSLFLFHDDFSNQCCGSPVLTFSIFETTKLKQRSINMLNNGATDIILTTTEEHKRLLEEAKITEKPIKVVNEGVDSCLFNTIPVDKYIDTKKFTYITIGKHEERKNTNTIVNTFINLFKDKEAALICHSFNPFLNNVQDHPFKNLVCWSNINPIKAGFEYKGFNGKAHVFTHKDCDIYFTTPNLSTSQMPSLMHSANVGIQISRGEGWDLPLTEMLACGLPTIATNCLGHSEYLLNTPTIQKELIITNTEKELAVDNIWFKGEQGDWDKLNVDEFIANFEKTFQNETYKNKNEELANYMENNYSWNKSTQKLLSIIKELRG